MRRFIQPVIALALIGLLVGAGSISSVSWAAGRGGDNNPQALYGQAKARIKQGKYAEAQAVLNQLKQENPDFAATWFAQGQLYESQGNSAAALEAYKNFVRASRGNIPPDPEVMLKLRKLGLY